jgi:hypothetical protein
MKRSELALLMMFGGAGMALVATSGCSSDDSGTSGSGGSGGQAGGSGGKAAIEGGSGGTATAGHGGVSGGGSVAGGSGLSGAGGSAGASGGLGGGGALAEGGAAGGMSDAGAGGEGPTTPCGPSSLTKPTVPTDIQVADSAVLVAAYAAEGTQTYTCQVTGAGDAATYAWSTASTPSANLYGSDCTIAVTHYAGPHWKANDGSIILGTKVRSVASSTAASIVQLLLSAVVDGGSTGILTPVTAVQRLNTVGGIAPSTGCDAAHVNGTVAVPYTATYYFYSGSNIIP